MSYRLELGLALLLAGAIAVAVWAAHRTPQPPAIDYRASTMLAGPSGSRALYDVLVRLRRPVQRRLTPLYSLNSESTRRATLLVELNPPNDLQDAEVEQVVRYVNAGGAVLSAGDGGGITGCAGWRLQPDGYVGDSVGVLPPAGVPGGNLPRVARVLARRSQGRAGGRPLSDLVKRRGEAMLNPCDSLLAVRSETLLATVKGAPAVLRIWYQRGGSITLASDAGWFRNRVWRDSDVPLVMLPLFASPRGDVGRVILDEYHQGFGAETESPAMLTWNWVRSTPLGWALLQLLAVALVWLATNSVRFGPAREVVERRRRSPLEHLEALGAGLESAAAADTAVSRLLAGLRRRLSRSGSVAADARQMQTWLETLELAVPDARGRAGVKRLRHLLSEHNGGDARVLAAAQTVEDVWEELHPRKTRERF